MQQDTALSKHLDLEEGVRNELAHALWGLLATTVDLYLRTQVAHWNIRGMAFVGLHQLFQQQYEELAEAIDEIAERIRALGFFVDCSLPAIAQGSLLAKDEQQYDATEMLQVLVESNVATARLSRQTLVLANDSDDGATADMLGRRLIAHEKASWMLASHLARP